MYNIEAGVLLKSRIMQELCRQRKFSEYAYFGQCTYKMYQGAKVLNMPTRNNISRNSNELAM